jgi:hypothetical protein
LAETIEIVISIGTEYAMDEGKLHMQAHRAGRDGLDAGKGRQTKPVMHCHIETVRWQVPAYTLPKTFGREDLGYV